MDPAHKARLDSAAAKAAEFIVKQVRQENINQIAYYEIDCDLKDELCAIYYRRQIDASEAEHEYAAQTAWGAIVEAWMPMLDITRLLSISLSSEWPESREVATRMLMRIKERADSSSQ